MCVVLCETSYTEHAVQCSGEFVTVNDTQFAESERQVTIGMWFQIVNKNASWAVHRLNCKVFAVDNRRVHVFFIVIPVSGSFPKGSLHNLRC